MANTIYGNLPPNPNTIFGDLPSYVAEQVQQEYELFKTIYPDLPEDSLYALAFSASGMKGRLAQLFYQSINGVTTDSKDKK